MLVWVFLKRASKDEMPHCLEAGFDRRGKGVDAEVNLADQIRNGHLVSYVQQLPFFSCRLWDSPWLVVERPAHREGSSFHKVINET